MAMNINIVINKCTQSKQCSKCLEVKPLTEFHKRKDSKDGHFNECKTCKNESIKKYYQENKQKIQQYKTKRYHSDEHFKRNDLLHRRINNFLKGKGNSAKTEELLGCDLNFFRNWIQMQFDHYMSWDNHDSCWDLDRVIPCSSFNLTDPDAQKRCFNGMNCQPMTKSDNCKKGTKRNIELEMQHSLKVSKLKELMNTPLL